MRVYSQIVKRWMKIKLTIPDALQFIEPSLLHRRQSILCSIKITWFTYEVVKKYVLLNPVPLFAYKHLLHTFTHHESPQHLSCVSFING